MKKTPNNKALKYSVYGALFALTLSLFGTAAPVLADTPLYATCVATPYNATVGDNVNWQVQNISGGSGAYFYAWNGTDNLFGSTNTAYKTYTYPGIKTASVTLTSGSQTFTATCSTNVTASNSYYNNYPYGYNGYYYQGGSYPYNTNNGSNYNYYNNSYNPNVACGGTWTNGVYYNTCNGNYGYSNISSNSAYYNGTYYTNPPINGGAQVYTTTYSGNAGTPVAGVFLSQVPSTGISAKNIKMILFTIGLLMWSAFAAYIVNFKRKNKLAAATPSNMSARIEAFKQRNLNKKNFSNTI